MWNALAGRWTGRIALAACVLLAGAASSQAQQPVIGVAAPLTGGNAILGEQITRGATVAATAVGAEVLVEDDLCTADSGAEAARRFADKKIVAVVGFLCTESLEAALPILKDAGITALTVGVRTNALTDKRAKTGWPIFRLAPRGDGESAAANEIIPRLWRDTPFAIIDDGAIQNRDLAESLRLATEEAGLKPVLVDGFRPGLESQKTMIGRLANAGAKAVFVAGDAADVAVLARDAKAAKLDITIAGGETLAYATDLPTGTLMIGLPVWRDLAEGRALAALDADGVLPDGYVLPAFAAVQVVAEGAKGDAAQPLAQRIQSVAMQTAIGPVRFDAKGDLTPPPYRAFAFDGKRFAPLESE